jgi:predicted outer membrane protein
MSASPRLRFGILAAGLSCLLAGYVVAQQEAVQEQPSAAIDQPAAQPTVGQTDRPSTQRREYTANFRGNQANAGAQQQEVQRYITGCLLSKNQAEVELGEFAQQQAQSPEVKEFAQMMVQDHNKLIQKLKQVAGTQGTANRTEGQLGERALPANRDVAGQNAAELNATNRTANSNSAVDQLLTLERQIVERCTQAAKEELQQKQDAEFDKCYIGSQIGGHMHMLAALEVIQQQGPEQLQQIAQQAQPNVQKHLDQAKQIMKQLEGAGATGTRAARQPTQPQR